MLKRKVWITTSFIAWHAWSKAPASCSYLKNPHRHVFHVRMKWDVKHNNRHIEFITMKEKVDHWIRCNWEGVACNNNSCEYFAEVLLTAFKATYVSVSEDNENGAEVEKI